MKTHEQLTGEERFHSPSGPVASVREYWAWAHSELLANMERGRVAEFLVALAVRSTDSPRREWDPWDLTTSDGLKIEVKSSAYVQSWTQKRPSRISFNVATTREWSPETGIYSSESGRHADVYVFCVLAEKEKLQVDVLDVGQWEFYVVPTNKIDALGTVKSLSIKRVQQLAGQPIRFAKLGAKLSDLDL